MKIFFHRSLLLLLLALQSVAPLVHAHVQVESNKGVHFHSFTVQTTQQSEVAALDNFGHCDAVIDIKLAVVQKKLLDCESDNDSLIFRQSNSSPAIVQSIVTASSTIVALIKTSPRLPTATPRGPPL